MKKVILNTDNLDKVYQLSERATKLLFYLISVMDENNVVLLSLNEAFYKIKLSVASLHRGRVELLEKGLIIDTYTKEDRRKYYRINTDIAQYHDIPDTKKNDMVDDEKNKDIVLGALKFVINNLKD
jgi:DNA-binding transcriptional regulator GbsR (MarR family)